MVGEATERVRRDAVAAGLPDDDQPLGRRRHGRDGLRWRAKVLDAAGNPMSVREALALINQILGEVLAEQEGDFDADSRWAVAWFEQHGFDEGDYGDAETLPRPRTPPWQAWRRRVS